MSIVSIFIKKKINLVPFFLCVSIWSLFWKVWYNQVFFITNIKQISRISSWFL